MLILFFPSFIRRNYVGSMVFRKAMKCNQVGAGREPVIGDSINLVNCFGISSVFRLSFVFVVDQITIFVCLLFIFYYIHFITQFDKPIPDPIRFLSANQFNFIIKLVAIRTFRFSSIPHFISFWVYTNI